MAKREFVMLAHEYEEDKFGIGDWFWSEKIDGQRAIWDGGFSRGVPAASVPYANVEKDGRYRNEIIATGLWSRYGKVIHAPGWWLDQLPNTPLDGELYMGRNQFQPLRSIVSELIAGPGWHNVKFKVFDSPPMEVWLADGKINNTNFKKEFRGIYQSLRDTVNTRHLARPERKEFEFVQRFLRTLKTNDVFQIHEQWRLPFTTKQAVDILNEKLFEITAAGGEGIILRHPMSIWAPERAWNLLKVKKMQDAEAKVIGYVWGRETDKGSKLLGMMGAMVCQLSNGTTFELSGFTEAEREMKLKEKLDGTSFSDNWQELYSAAATIGRLHPGEPVREDIENPKFPRGSTVTFKYREFTDAGKPKEARFYRKM